MTFELNILGIVYHMPLVTTYGNRKVGNGSKITSMQMLILFRWFTPIVLQLSSNISTVSNFTQSYKNALELDCQNRNTWSNNPIQLANNQMIEQFKAFSVVPEDTKLLPDFKRLRYHFVFDIH